MNKIVLVGCGNVGIAYAYSLVSTSTNVDELVLIDIDVAKAEGEALDLMHAAAATGKRINIHSGTYRDCKDATIICIAAGKNQEVGETRTDLISKNYDVFHSIISSINKTKFAGIYLIATNPLDVMTHITRTLSSLPPHRVIGSGTTLDTARLRSMVATELNIHSANIHGYVIGEHGDSELVAWSCAMIGLNKVTDHLTPEQRHQIAEDVKNSAYSIIAKKGNTAYGIGICLLNITNAVLNDSHKIMTISAYSEKEELYYGMPAVIGRNGVENVLQLTLSAAESRALQHSISCIRANIATLQTHL